MEPVSILSAASAVSAVAGKAWELGSYIRELYQGAKTVDGKVRRLESAVTELARACEHVQGQFEGMSSPASSKTPGLAWDEQGALTASIDIQVKDCRKTLRELKRLLTDLRPSSSSFFGRTSRHLKLQDRSQQINDFSVRVKTHTDALQMSLQIVIIKIVLATPDFLLRQLGTALEDLRVRLSRIEVNAKPSEPRVDAQGTQFLERAREALRSGTTLYEASIAGSVADVEPAAGSERAARIKEWADKVDALRGNHTDVSSVNRPSTVLADVLPEKEPCTNVVEKLSDVSSVGASVDLYTVDEPASGSENNTFVQAEAVQDISVGCNGGRLSVSEQSTGVALTKEHIGVLDDANTTDTESARLDTASSSLHISSRSSSANCTHRSLRHESTGTTPHLATTNNVKASDQDTILLTKPSQQDLNKTKGISSQQTLEDSSSTEPSLRTRLVKRWKIEINGQLEASICAGNSINPATLPKLVPSQAASSIRRPATTWSQPKRDGLALLLAVFFRDIYLIKPLIERGYSPHANLVYSRDRQHITPMEFAIATSCEPVIEELLDNVPVLPCARDQLVCRALLNHENLESCPPTGVEAIKRVIDLLMPARSSAHAACGCTRFPAPYSRDPCHELVWHLIYDACNMPSHLHDYRVPLVTHLLKYTRSLEDLPSYRVLDVRLATAVILGLPTVVKFLLTETTNNSLLRTWLQKMRFASLLDLAIRNAKNFPEIPLDTVRALLEMEAELQAKSPADHRAVRSRKKAVDLALESGRADLISLVERYSKA